MFTSFANTVSFSGLAVGKCFIGVENPFQVFANHVAGKLRGFHLRLGHGASVISDEIPSVAAGVRDAIGPPLVEGLL
jgi:hypothetical protein